jgi:hypothetical protein
MRRGEGMRGGEREGGGGLMESWELPLRESERETARVCYERYSVSGVLSVRGATMVHPFTV